MIVYNISVKVDNDIEQAWVQWQQREHIPEILATQLFNDCAFFKLLDHEHEESSTYIIQFSTDARGKYDQYVSVHAKKLQQKAFQKWGNSFVAFRSLMQKVN